MQHSKLNYYINDNGISITETDTEINLFYYYGDEVELSHNFTSYNEIEKVFGKSIDDIDCVDLMQYEQK